MKRYRHLLIYGLIILVTIGSYIGYTLSIQGADLSLKTVSGKSSEIENFNLRLQTKGMRSTIYDVNANGDIEKQSNSYVGQLFRKDGMTALPDEYYTFTTQMETNVSGDEQSEYAIQIKHNRLQFKMFTFKTKEMFEKTFKYETKLETGTDLQASVVDKQAMKVYIQLDRVDQPMETKLLVLDLAGDQVEEIVLQKSVTPNHSRQFLAIHQNEVVYTEQPSDSDEQNTKLSYFLDDGKSAQSIKELNQQEIGYTPYANGRYLIGFRLPEGETKRIEWSKFDLEAKQLSEHSVSSPLVMKKIDWLDSTDEMQLYLASETNDGFQMSVIDLKNEHLMYQGEIKDANHKKGTSIYDFAIQ
ncbi:hypothetical protein [Exiguobacterium acetylicum]|uniref:hypothetical protein n=1 Tax=Exiguobacterium acetylicum TaxID=41170 RepID=UPI001EE19314|nr:hypothetical protein [Exiguobacterium acetylicum]UKS57275.1 hypothetical protein K6T22_06580 [Exiguobacterium acetylicum]